MYEAVLFDFDGTLVDTRGDIAACTNYALDAMGIEPIDSSLYAGFVGYGLKVTIRKALVYRGLEADEELVSVLSKLQLGYYAAHPADLATAYPGVDSLLARLRKPFGVLSNKNDDLVREIVRRLFPGTPFPFARGMVPGMPHKPDPASLEPFLAQFHVPASRVLYVGDTEVDAGFAKAAGTSLALVSWGYRKKEQLLPLGRVCDTTDELEALITKG